MKLLLGAGADHSTCTMMGWQPYGTAAVHGHKKVADLLEKHGAHPYAGYTGLEGVDMGGF